MVWSVCVVFFFSSRRRHTRCSRDWSSDVCSSDLPAVVEPARRGHRGGGPAAEALAGRVEHEPGRRDRKSTRLNSSHGYISYAVFCLKKKKNRKENVKNIHQEIDTKDVTRETRQKK